MSCKEWLWVRRVKPQKGLIERENHQSLGSPLEKVMGPPLIAIVRFFSKKNGYLIQEVAAWYYMFCYPVLFAAILEPMKVALWRLMWWLLVGIVVLIKQAAPFSILLA